MTRALRLAVVGAGRIAQVAHLPAIEKTSEVELAAVCDRSESIVRAVARRYRTRPLTDVADVLTDPTIEAVLVTAPDRLHFRLAAQALAAGKHVLVEKPMTATAAEAAELVELAASTSAVLQVGSMKRHDAGLEYAAAFVRDKLGEVRSFHAWYRIGRLRAGIEATLFPPVVEDPVVRGAETQAKADRRHYLLATHGAHVFDTLRFVVGEVGSVAARHRADARDHAWELLLTTTGGAVGTASLAMDVPGEPEEGLEVFGSAGSVRVETPFPFYRRPSSVTGYADGARVRPVLVDGDAYSRQLAAFVACVRTGSPPSPGASDGCAAVRLIEATAAAVASGDTVML